MDVAIVGTGYVGLVTGVSLASRGHRVICVDVSPARVGQINEATAPFHEPGLTPMLQQVVGNGGLSATTDLEAAVSASRVTFVAVGTPSAADGSIDLSHVAQAAAQIGRALRDVAPYHVLAVKSTVLPGTTQGLVRHSLEEASGRRVGEIGLCMNPEFLREGSALADSLSPDRIVIGQWDRRSGDVLEQLYASFQCPKLRTSLRNAEMTKYACNALLATLVSFSNEIAALCEAMPDADADVVMQGLHLDRRLSPLVDGQRISPGILSYLRCGCGFGGSCLPKDVNALRHLARSLQVQPLLLDAVAQINARRADETVALLERALGNLKNKQVAVLGLAFKPGTDDMRDSPALRIIDALLRSGAHVRGYDPLAFDAAGRTFGQRILLEKTAAAALHGADAAVLASACPEFTQWNWEPLVQAMRHPVILDARCALRNVTWPAGVRYLSLGTKSQDDHHP